MNNEERRALSEIEEFRTSLYGDKTTHASILNVRYRDDVQFLLETIKLRDRKVEYLTQRICQLDLVLKINKEESQELWRVMNKRIQKLVFDAYVWLGMCRDHLPPKFVPKLQDILENAKGGNNE